MIIPVSPDHQSYLNIASIIIAVVTGKNMFETVGHGPHSHCVVFLTIGPCTKCIIYHQFDFNSGHYFGSLLSFIIIILNFTVLLSIWNRKIHCFCLLLLPIMASRHGRRVVLVMLLTSLLNGPAANMRNNTSTVVKHFTDQTSF